jgi:hypothetical protein
MPGSVERQDQAKPSLKTFHARVHLASHIREMVLETKVLPRPQVALGVVEFVNLCTTLGAKFPQSPKCLSHPKFCSLCKGTWVNHGQMRVGKVLVHCRAELLRIFHRGPLATGEGMSMGGWSNGLKQPCNRYDVFEGLHLS